MSIVHVQIPYQLFTFSDFSSSVFTLFGAGEGSTLSPSTSPGSTRAVPSPFQFHRTLRDSVRSSPGIVRARVSVVVSNHIALVMASE